MAVKPPGTGVFLPQINAAAVAIELYLKCLSSKRIYTPTEIMPEVSIVTAEPEKKGHELKKIFKKIPTENQADLKQLYKDQFPESEKDFCQALSSLEGAFMASRYSFEKDSDITSYSLSDLGNMVIFLDNYTAKLEVKEIITWPED